MKKIVFYFILFFPILIFSYSNICSNIETEQKKFFVYSDFLYWKTQEDGLDFIYDDPNQIITDVKNA